MRAALVVTLAAGASALAGCESFERRFMEGTSETGEPCAHWSWRHGSAATCCAAVGGAYSDGTCFHVSVPGPFVPPSIPA